MNKAFKAAFVGATLALAGGGLALTAPVAHAANSNSATTAITNDYDSGGQGNWANDNFTRTLTFTQEDASYCESANHGTPIPAGQVCDQVSVSDSGTFTSLLNAFQPNQDTSGGVGTLSNKTILNVVNGHFTGTDTWAIETASTNEPDPTLVTSSLDDSYTHPSSGKDSTSYWYLQAFPSGGPSGSVVNTTWGWTYTTSCGESWTDSSASGAGNNGFDGQSSPTSVDGNITGITNCAPDTVSVGNPGTQTATVNNFTSLNVSASTSNSDSITSYLATGLPSGLSINTSTGVISGTPNSTGNSTVTVTANDSDESGSATFAWDITSLPPVTITFGTYGNNVNPFGNGFDVFKQHAAVNNPIVGWPATQHDPATHFLKEAEGSHFRFEYAPNGVGDGLCVSNPGDNALVLRACNPNIWQQFDYAGGHIISVVTGGIVNPNGTGNQLTVGSSPVPWGGSKYHWTAFSSLPA